MKLGFFTSCVPGVPLPEVVAFAAQHGYQALEIAAWPQQNDRDFSATSLDVERFTDEQAGRIQRLMTEHGIEIASLGYYENNLHHDLGLRESYRKHLYKVIDAAAALSVPYVGTFVGRDVTRSIADNLDEFRRVFPAIVQYAADSGVKLMIENCPMEGWHPDGLPGQIAYSPEIFEAMFEAIDSPFFGLNLDPSHLYWLGIDAIAMVKQFAPKIFQAHAKDTEILGSVSQYGIFGKQVGRQSGWDQGWWRYRMPGLGAIHWGQFIRALYDVGFDGVLSVEHEDPVFGGSRDLVERGLILAQRHLSPWLV